MPPEGQAVDRSVPAGSLRLEEEDFRLDEAVELHGHVTPVEETVFRFRGKLATTLSATCVRCLEAFDLPVSEELDLLYLPQSRNVAPVVDEETGTRDFDRGLSAEELAVAFYRDDQIDLSHLVLEQIILALPMKPLCTADCRGLCPECGANRNTSNCECVVDETDPRWAALKTLLER